MYIDKLDDVVDEYNNTYHTTIKMKSIDVKDNTYINTSKEISNKDPKFKVGDRARISKYKNIFAKSYTPNWSEEIFVIKKIRNTVQKEFRIEKVIKKKGNKLYVKWKGYNSSFNSWIDKKDLV